MQFYNISSNSWTILTSSRAIFIYFFTITILNLHKNKEANPSGRKLLSFLEMTNKPLEENVSFKAIDLGCLLLCKW